MNEVVNFGTALHSEREIGNGSEMPDLGRKLAWICTGAPGIRVHKPRAK
jgi:hypothetical protein